MNRPDIHSVSQGARGELWTVLALLLDFGGEVGFPLARPMRNWPVESRAFDNNHLRCTFALSPLFSFNGNPTLQTDCCTYLNSIQPLASLGYVKIKM